MTRFLELLGTVVGWTLSIRYILDCLLLGIWDGVRGGVRVVLFIWRQSRKR